MEVLEVHDFDGAVHVAVGEADEGAGDAAAGPEDDVGVGAAASGHGFVLDVDFFGGGDFFEAGDDFGVVAAAVGEGWAFAEFGVAVLALVHGGVIGGVGDIDDEGGVGFEGVGDLAGAKEADFFHDVGNGADFGFEFFLGLDEEAQGFGHGPGANTVVKSAGDGEVVFEQGEVGINGDGVADLDMDEGLHAVMHADVDEEFFDLGNFAFALGLHEVRGDIADDAVDGAFFGVNDDALGFGDGGIHAAETAHVDESFLVDEIDRHGDFIRMAGEHDAWAAAFVEDGDAVTVGVAEGFVGVFFDVVEPDALAAEFVAGRAGGVEQLLQKLQ